MLLNGHPDAIRRYLQDALIDFDAGRDPLWVVESETGGMTEIRFVSDSSGEFVPNGYLFAEED